MVMVVMESVLLDVAVTVTGKMGRIALIGVGLSCAVAVACASGLLVMVVIVHSLALRVGLV